MSQQLLKIVTVDSYRNAYANDHNISFMPSVTSTSGTVHCELLCILFLQAHSETEEYCDRSCLPAQHKSDFFKSKRPAFYGAIKSKAGLAFAKSAAMRVTMHIDKSPAVVEKRRVRVLKLPLSLENLTLGHHVWQGPKTRNFFLKP